MCKELLNYQKQHEKDFSNFFNLKEIDSDAEILLNQFLNNPEYGLSRVSNKTPIIEIAKAMGFKIFTARFNDRNLSGTIGISKKLQGKYGSDKVIILNNQDTDKHILFTLAHEIAHYIFDYISDSSKEYSNSYRTDESKNDSEIRANRFAASFLMPASSFSNAYRALLKDGFDKEKLFEHFSPEIRDQSFINGLNKYLQQIEFKCGLAYGTLSDPQQVDKTAEEIKTSKQRSYQLISDIQGSLENALRGLINSIDDLCIANGLFDGGEINVAFTWDDSIIIDAAKEKQQDIQDINTGILNKYEYRMKWYGEDEETAKAKIAEMNSSRPGITSAFMRDDVGEE